MQNHDHRNYSLYLWIVSNSTYIDFLSEYPVMVSLQDYVETINALPEFDKPSYFNLPENIERASQRNVSNMVISQLRVLMRADAKANKFDKELWQTELSPLLNLWKRLNQVCLNILCRAPFIGRHNC